MENKLEKIGQNSFMDNFVKTDDIVKDMCGIIESSQKAAYQAVNIALVQRNQLLGYRIAEEELGGQERSEYGLQIIKKLSKELTNRYGKGYDKGTLYRCLKFYKMFPEIVASVRQQSGAILSWTHYRILLQVEDKAARDWYEKEAAEQTWSVRTLQRNISSQYYYRMLGTQKKEPVENEMKELTVPYQKDKLELYWISLHLLTDLLYISGLVRNISLTNMKSSTKPKISLSLLRRKHLSAASVMVYLSGRIQILL